jgi:hypothetical protein
VLAMFILDSLMISGIRWTLETVVKAAEAEMNDDTALREQLLEAEMRREMGEITDDEFEEIEADLLGRIREIKERREGAGPLAFGGAPMETSPDSRFQVEASVSGDFYDPAEAPHTTVIEASPRGAQEVAVLEMEPGDAAGESAPALPLSPPGRSDRAGRSKRSSRSKPSNRSKRSSRAKDSKPANGRTARTARTSRTKT